MKKEYLVIKDAADFIKRKININTKTAIVLGSGLGEFHNEIKDSEILNYDEIPNFPETTVEGHDGKFIYGNINGKDIIALKGRFHFYEGYDIAQVVFPIRVLKLLGIENIIVTNAAGGINSDFIPSDLMIIKDHIGFFAPSPLIGGNMDEFGVRFPNMCGAYNEELINIAKIAAKNQNLDLKEGVYAYTKGPMYETPAEVRALKMMGADAVGMSTVPEVITARHAGINILGISCITNMAAGILNKDLSHNEVIETAKTVETKFASLIKGIIAEI